MTRQLSFSTFQHTSKFPLVNYLRVSLTKNNNKSRRFLNLSSQHQQQDLSSLQATTTTPDSNRKRTYSENKDSSCVIRHNLNPLIKRGTTNINNRWEMLWPSKVLTTVVGVLSASVLYSKYTNMDKPSASGSRKDDKESSDEGEKGASSKTGIDSLLEMFARKLGLSKDNVDHSKDDQVLEDVNFDGVVKYIKSGKCKNIVVLAGAGISTSAGIPDFRSPGSGLYNNLKKYKLPCPEAIFELNFFKSNPEPFFALAKELYPGSFQPTKSHYFVRLLHEKELLLRMYTQNIDTLERIAGIPEEKLVEAHGTFHTSHCVRCGEEYTLPWMKEKIFSEETPKCTKCSSLVKPDIVFFGEELPNRFYSLTSSDFPKCDLLIVMGTSLVVQPFASLIDRVPRSTPRLLINKEKSGETDETMLLLGFGGGMMFDSEHNYRDVAWLGTCDDGCQALADALNWGQDLKRLVSEEHAKIVEAESASSKKK